jgi:thioredoxin-related protein
MPIRGFTALLLAGFLAAAPATHADDPTPDTSNTPPDVDWLRFDEGIVAARESNKQIMVDVYTNWCHWCKKLDQYTYSDRQVREVLARSYVSVKLKGDSDRRLKVKGQPAVEDGKTLLQFVPTDTAGITERDLSRTKLQVRGYPTILFLSPDGKVITSFASYVEAEAFHNLLNFIKDDLYEVMTYKEYLQSLEKARELGQEEKS